MQDIRNPRREQFRNRTRTATRGIRANLSMAGRLAPWRHPGAALAIWSHKLLRWATPWFLAVAGLAGWALGGVFLLVPLAIAATLGQMIAKTALYAGGQRLANALPAPRRARVDRACAAFASRPRLQNATLLASAIVGMPPFYVVTLAYGVLRLPFTTFVTLGTIGRAIRFSAIVFMPRLVTVASSLALLAVAHGGGAR